MSDSRRVPLRRLPTGVPGLDQVLGGGLPEYSFNLIAGAPGGGKSTLAHQIMFANASAQRPALYFTVLGEPSLKMLRYQQQMDFFDVDRVGSVVRFVDLSQEVLSKDLGEVLGTIVRTVNEVEPAIVVVDSFRTVVRTATAIEAGEMQLQAFLQRLSLHLTSWQATTFLVGEYAESEVRDNPVFTVADGILWLHQIAERSSVVRKLQVMKMRGQAHMPGLHTFRITNAGVQVFPRIVGSSRAERGSAERVSTGIAGLDAMLEGGIPAGDAVLVAGPSGAGKTAVGTQFIAEGGRLGERCVIAVFEEHPPAYLARAKALGVDLESMISRGDLAMINLRPLDLSADETLQEMRELVEQTGAKRVVIDSLSGFELALAPAFRHDFRESLYRMLAVLTGLGVTVLLTVEVTDSYDELRFSPHTVSFFTDDILLMRYVEIAGQLRKALAVVKMRHSSHSKDLRSYDITGQGIVVGPTFREYRGVLTGAPEIRIWPPSHPGLIEKERFVLEVLVDLREATTEELAQRTSFRKAELTKALNRLLDLGYVVKVTDAEKIMYRLCEPST